MALEARKETIQRKKIKEGRNEQANGKHDEHRTKAHQQRQLKQSKHPQGQSRFYGVVVSTLDFESNDTKLTLGITDSQFFIDDVDYSPQ